MIPLLHVAGAIALDRATVSVRVAALSSGAVEGQYQLGWMAPVVIRRI